MTSLHAVAIVAAIMAISKFITAWMPPTGYGMKSRGTSIPTWRFLTYLNSQKPEVTIENNEGDLVGKNVVEDEVDNKPAVEWGVSYIGGDPCGSKYNSDPFDKKPSDKPGLPGDIKARIAALAEKKLQEERERES